MTSRGLSRSVVVLGAVLAFAGGLAFEAWAAYDLELTTEDYAITALYWFPAVFRTAVENTGTVADTIDLHLDNDLPPGGWSSDLCIRGKCIPNDGYVYLEPGEVETVLVDIYVGGSQNMGLVTMTASMRHDPGTFKTETYAAFAQLPSFLLVYDGADDPVTYETYLKTAIEDAGYKARVWHADSLGRPGPVQLLSYWGVFWTTADTSFFCPITSGDEQDMVTYLDAGGNLFLASMDFLSSRGGPTTFTTNYLHAASWTSDTDGGAVSGYPGDPISDSMTLPLTGGPFSATNTDNMTLNMPGDSIFASVAGVSGLKVAESGHKIVFLSFPFECVSTSDPDPDNQAILISRVIDWFDPPTAGVDDRPDIPQGELVLRQNHPNPFSSITGISFAVPQGSRYAELMIYNVKGQVVRSLMSGRPVMSENHVVWDGRDDAGAPVASGVYFYKLSTDRASTLKKMVLLK